MRIKTEFAKIVGKSAYVILTKLGRGSSYPGKIAYKIDPDILNDLGKKYNLIIVTGTNGKTLTTSLSHKVLSQSYSNILTNPAGSNMIQGVVTSFLTHKKVKGQKPFALLEVDEANVATICKYIKPKYFLLTNIFRDQMDRYGEIYTTYQKIVDGIKMAPDATVIANGDASIFSSIELPNKFVYYGFSDLGHENEDFKAPANTDGVLCPRCEKILHYHYISYANLGSFFCPNCGYKRPELKYQVTDILEQKPNKSTFAIDDFEYTINIGGLYNIYNALAAYTLGRELGVTQEQISAAFDYDEQVFGRQEVVSVDGHDLSIILVKNPVGLNQVFNTIQTDDNPYSLGFLLNANYADGIDTSWIWDADFEDLPYEKIPSVVTGGERHNDINFRFKISGIPENKLHQVPEIDDFVKSIKNFETKKIYVLATYTAMLQLRKKLSDLGYIK